MWKKAKRTRRKAGKLCLWDADALFQLLNTQIRLFDALAADLALCHHLSDGVDNLLDNAVKYSPAGEAVLLHVETRDEQLIITVRDHGPGLREEDMPKLFTSFYRGGNTSHISGTGLGLAIVKRCATALGGDVSARNANDGGAEFIVMLPPLPNSNLQSEI